MAMECWQPVIGEVGACFPNYCQDALEQGIDPAAVI